MINQAIHNNGIEDHLLCTIQCHLNGVHVSEVPNFLAESSSMTTQAIQQTGPNDVAHPLIITFQLSGVTSYFDVYSLSIAECENEHIA